MSEDIQELGGDQPPQIFTPPPKKRKTFLSPQSVEGQHQHPTVLPSDDHKGPCTTIATMRRTETFQEAKEIHGADSKNALPAQVGLLETIEKRCPKKILVEFMSKSKKFSNKVFPKIYRAATKKFEESEENMLRSVAVFYSKGVMGKKKYRSVYRSLSMTNNTKEKSKTTRINVMSCPLPRIVPFNTLFSFQCDQVERS